MDLHTLCLFPIIMGVASALSFKSTMQYGRRCGLRYGDVMKSHDWVCDDSQFQAYPTQQIQKCLQKNINLVARDYLSITNNCGTFHDSDSIYGKNEYYTHESVCKMVRKPIRVLWYKVPGYKVPADLMTLNNGLLPVHVLEGQKLFDVKCFHPWSKGIPKHLPKRMSRRLKTIRWDEVKERLCLSGYTYNYNLVCKPTGYMERQVYVYSEHADMIFSVIVPDVPTSCACSYCSCSKTM